MRQRQAAAFGLLDHARAHALQGIEHAPHRPLAQGGIAVERGRHRAAGHRADRQPHAGAGIAEIERACGGGKAADAHAMDAPDAVAAALQPRAQRAHGVGGMQHVLAFQQPRHRAFADRQRAQNEGPVRDRLVPRHPGAALQGPAAAGGQRRRNGGVHGLRVLNNAGRPTMRPRAPSSRRQAAFAAIDRTREARQVKHRFSGFSEEPNGESRSRHQTRLPRHRAQIL